MPKRPMSKSAKIRRALARGESVSAIVAKYQTTPSMVYNIRSSLRRKERGVPQAEGATIIASSPAGSSGIITLNDPAPVPPGGITYVVTDAPAPTAVVDKPLGLWARFKLWAFGVKG